jgi:hypothetical protein
VGEIAVVGSDIWRAHLYIIGQRLPAVVYILDRFQTMEHFGKVRD